jgi:ferredoxin
LQLEACTNCCLCADVCPAVVGIEVLDIVQLVERVPVISMSPVRPAATAVWGNCWAPACFTARPNPNIWWIIL